jgi:hypothetical protein
MSLSLVPSGWADYVSYSLFKILPVIELLDRLQNGTHRGKGGAADHSACGGMELGTACKADSSGMEHVSIKSSRRKDCVFVLRKLRDHRKIPLIIIIIIISHRSLPSEYKLS